MTRVQHLTINKEKGVECGDLTCFDVSRAAPSSPHIAHGLLTSKHQRKTIGKDQNALRSRPRACQFQEGLFGSREVSSVLLRGFSGERSSIF